MVRSTQIHKSREAALEPIFARLFPGDMFIAEYEKAQENVSDIYMCVLHLHLVMFTDASKQDSRVRVSA